MFGLDADKRQKFFLFGWNVRAAALVDGLLHNIFSAEADKAIQDNFGASIDEIKQVAFREGEFNVEEWRKLYDKGLIEKIKIVNAHTVEDAMLYICGAVVSSVRSFVEEDPRFYLPGDVLIAESEKNGEMGVVYSRKGMSVRIVGELLLF